MGMELRDIEYFAVVAERGSIGRAAEKLGLSQPALSKSLRRLEGSVGAKVVKRTPKGVELTAVGSALLAQVRRLRLTLDDISREASDLSEGRAGHLRIGTGVGAALYLVPRACAALLKDAPKVTLKIVAGERHALLTSLCNAELDLVVNILQASRYENLFEDYLYDQPFVVYASANHRLSNRKEVTLADLAQERWALSLSDSWPEQYLSRVFGDNGLPPPSIALETTNLPTRHHLIGASELLGFSSRQSMQYFAAQFPVVELRVKDITVTCRIGAFYRKDAYLSPAARRFIEILKVTAKDIAKENR